MSKTFITELVPTSSQKSFAGRAHVIESDDRYYLKSYDTIVGSVGKSGDVHRYWSGRSNTTSKHIASFLGMFGNCAVKTVKEFYRLELVDCPASITVKL